ncbi:MAG: carboxypeptidase-like regulatory domain-containing protein [Ekhidna sp.]
MNRNLFIIFSLLLSLSGTSQKVDQIVKPLYHESKVDSLFNEMGRKGLPSRDVEWLYEFSSKDSILLLHTLNEYVITEPQLRVSKIQLSLDSTERVNGLFYADLIEKKHHTPTSYRRRAQFLEDKMNTSLVRLSGLGYYSHEDDSFQKLKEPNSDTNSKSLENSMNGVVLNSKTNQPVSYVSIGIANKNIGTVSNMDGEYTLKIPLSLLSDSITFSSIGYHSAKMLASNAEISPIYMTENAILLEEVVVETSAKSKKVVLGTKKHSNNKSGFISGKGAGAEAAKKIIPPKSGSIYLNTAEIYVFNKLNQSFSLLVHVYEHNEQSDLPGKELLKRKVLIQSSIDQGWVSVNLNDQQLVFDKPFYVSFQWIDENTQNPMISLKGKNSLMRSISLGKWIKPRDFNWAIRVNATVID